MLEEIKDLRMKIVTHIQDNLFEEDPEKRAKNNEELKALKGRLNILLAFI